MLGVQAPQKAGRVPPTQPAHTSSVTNFGLHARVSAQPQTCLQAGQAGTKCVQRNRRSVRVLARKDEDEADWEKEMSIFKQRMMRPNQLATLRELESKVNVGKVLYCKDNLAIIAGLNSDAPLGTKLAFVSGGLGVLLWHRSDDLSFALVLGGADSITVGQGVECKLRGILQVVDDAKGPITKKDFELFEAPAGDSLFGHVVDFLGRPQPQYRSGGAAPAGGAPLGVEKTRPLINQQVSMKNREQISESLLTGVKALDVLTPLGRGASLLVVGPSDSGKTTLALDAVLGQRHTGVKCVYACIGLSTEHLERTAATLEAAGGMGHTVLLAAPEGTSLGKQYAALCMACSIGERVRDEGGHALVVLDNLSPLAAVWDTLVMALAELGREKLRAGLIKDESGRDIELEPQTEQELVDYEGMLVSGAVAQRRGFFSTLFMRAAKLHRSQLGGSMTLLPLVPGRPATGQSKRVDMSKYQTLTEEQKERIRTKLEAKAAAEAAQGAAPGEMVTEAVEEFISIADGQVVLQPRPSPSSPYTVNPKLSITRIGMRAYPKALAALAPQIRLDLTQAADARAFGMNPSDPHSAKYDVYTRRLAEALVQSPGCPATLEEQVVILYAIQQGFADDVLPSEMGTFLKHMLNYVRVMSPEGLAEVKETRQLTATAEVAIKDALVAFISAPSTAEE